MYQFKKKFKIKTVFRELYKKMCAGKFSSVEFSEGEFSAVEFDEVKFFAREFSWGKLFGHNYINVDDFLVLGG